MQDIYDFRFQTTRQTGCELFGGDGLVRLEAVKANERPSLLESLDSFSALLTPDHTGSEE